MASQLYRSPSSTSSVGCCDTSLKATRMAIIMMGMPATGKTFTARNLSRYLRWMGVRTKTFSVARYRKFITTDSSGISHDNSHLRASFFNPENQQALQQRTIIADMALNDLLAWLSLEDGQGSVGILDGSNTTSHRRQVIKARLEAERIKCIFLECVYMASSEFIARHVDELRFTCPEYIGVDSQVAIKDFCERIEYYRPHYEPLNEHSDSYIQYCDNGNLIVVNRVQGYLPSRVIYYLMNLRMARSKSIFLHAVDSRPAYDSLQDLSSLLLSHLQRNVEVWTNTAVAHSLPSVIQKPRLRAIDLGNASDLEAHCADPYFHRYPQGESYHDLTVRLEPIIMELEGTCRDTLIAADISVIRCLYGYFVEAAKDELTRFAWPGDVLMELRPRAYGCYERSFRIASSGLLPLTPECLRPYNDNFDTPF